MALKGDQVRGDEGIAGQARVVQREREECTEGVEAVVRQTLSVGPQDQKPIEQQLLVAKSTPAALTQEARLEQGEAAANGAPPVGTQGVFVNPGVTSLPTMLLLRSTQVDRVLFCQIV